MEHSDVILYEHMKRLNILGDFEFVSQLLGKKYAVAFSQSQTPPSSTAQDISYESPESLNGLQQFPDICNQAIEDYNQAVANYNQAVEAFQQCEKSLSEEKQQLSKDRDAFAQEKAQLAKERQAFEQEKAKLDEERADLEQQKQALPSAKERRQEAQNMYDSFSSEMSDAMKQIRQLSNLAKNVQELAKRTTEVRKVVRGDLFHSGIESLAHLHQGCANRPDDKTAQYVTQRLEHILCSEFTLTKIEPTAGSDYQPSEHKAQSIRDNHCIRRCITCGWKLDDTVILEAVVELEDN